MGDSSPSVSFEQSPQQQQLWSLAYPYWQNLYGGQMPGLYNVPALPSAADYFAATMPTGDWWANLDPSIKAGIRAPYEDASQQMMEQMGARGQIGGQSTPYSGTGQAALGTFWDKAGQGMAQTGWGMMHPGLMAQAQAGWGGAMQGWGAELGREQAGYQQSMLPYQMLPGMTQQAMPYPVVDPGGGGFWGGVGNLAGSALMGMGMGWGMSGFQNPFGSYGSTVPIGGYGSTVPINPGQVPYMSW